MILPILLALLPPFILHSEQSLLEAEVRGSRVLASARLDGASAESLLAAVREGLTSEIVFQLRLYRRQRGFGSLFGDRLIREKTVVRLGAMNAFDRRFTIRGDTGLALECREEQAFVRQFFELDGCDLGELSGEDPGRLYVLARIRYSPVRLVPPLNIITLFTRRTAITTGWAEARLGVSGETD